jgi:hypothetical protein
MEILKDYFEPISYTEEFSAVFLNTRKIDAEAIEISHSRHFSHDQFFTNIKAASRHWPYAKQKSDLYSALLAIDAADNVLNSAWQVAHKLREAGGEQKITPEAVYAAFAQD